MHRYAPILTMVLCIIFLAPLATMAGQKADKKVDKEAAKEKDALEAADTEKAPKPHPLVGQIEAALAQNLLIEPAGTCAWDLYQILKASVPSEPAIKPLAEKLFVQLGTTGSEPLKLYLQGANRSFMREDWARAQQYIERARQLHPENRELKVIELFYQGMIALAEKQPDKAESLFRQGIKQDEKAAYLYNGLGRALSDQKKDAESLKTYQKASLLAPQWTYPLVNAAIKWQQRGDLEMARRTALAAVEINTNDIEAHAILAAVNTSLGNFEDAIREYQLVILQRPNSVADHIALGLLLLEREDYLAAEQVLANAVRLNPLDARARLYLSIATLRRARALFDSALAQVREAAKLSPDDWQLQLALATAANEQNNRTEVIDAYRAALKIEPWHVDVRLQLARLLSETDRTNEAGDEYRTILKTNPNNKEAHNGLGLTFKKSGQLKEAILEYRKALSLDETFVPARLNLATALQEKGEVEAAAAEYRAILTTEPTNAAAASALKEIESKLEQSQKRGN